VLGERVILPSICVELEVVASGGGEEEQWLPVGSCCKKVVAEYVSCGRFMKAEERVWKKLDKKLNSLPTVQVNNDRVSLVDEWRTWHWL